MSSPPSGRLGLDAVRVWLEMHYEYDATGRIVGERGGGETPRFVLGRSPEGCLWRFGRTLDRDALVRVGRLAAREPGISFEGAGKAPEPVRLGMIERVLGVDRRLRPTRRLPILTQEGVVLGDVWIVV